MAQFVPSPPRRLSSPQRAAGGQTLHAALPIAQCPLLLLAQAVGVQAWWRSDRELTFRSRMGVSQQMYCPPSYCDTAYCSPIALRVSWEQSTDGILIRTGRPTMSLDSGIECLTSFLLC